MGITQAQIEAAFLSALQKVGFTPGSSGVPAPTSPTSPPTNIAGGSSQISSQAQILAADTSLGLNQNLQAKLGFIEGFTRVIGAGLQGVEDASIAFLKYQDERFRETRDNYNYLFDFREKIGGIKIEELEDLQKINGLAGTALTQHEAILGLATNAEGYVSKLAMGTDDTKNPLSRIFKRGEDAARSYMELFNEIASTTPKMLEDIDETQAEALVTFKQSLQLTDRDINELLKKQYADTGEASSKILEEITDTSLKMSKATGLGANQLKDDIIDITKDVNTFGNVGVEAAGRISAALAQTGLSLEGFKKLLGDFQTFDAAAGKMGDLSAMFGIQLDAMEMAYLANEDQEEFLHTLREQIIDSGIDVDNMSQARSRALADQMGMNVSQMKIFLKEGQSGLDREALDSASNIELEYNSITNAVEYFADKQAKAALTTEEAFKEKMIPALIATREEMLRLGRVAGESDIATFENIKASTEALELSKTAMRGYADTFEQDIKPIAENVAKSVNTIFNDTFKAGKDVINTMVGVDMVSLEKPIVKPFKLGIDDETQKNLQMINNAQKSVMVLEINNVEDIKNVSTDLKMTADQLKTFTDALNNNEKQLIVTLDGQVITDVVIKNFQSQNGNILTNTSTQ